MDLQRPCRLARVRARHRHARAAERADQPVQVRGCRGHAGNQFSRAFHAGGGPQAGLPHRTCIRYDLPDDEHSKTSTGQCAAAICAEHGDGEAAGLRFPRGWPVTRIAAGSPHAAL